MSTLDSLINASPPITALGPWIAMSSLEGKVYAFTGGASGIGLATAKIVAGRGAAVCIADVDPDAMRDAEAYFSAKESPFSVTRVDVSVRKEVDAWIAGIVEKFGRLDGAANVAGIIGKHHGSRAVAELEDDEWDKIIAVNLTGCMYCMRAELRNVVDGGSIVNVSSIHGVKGSSGRVSLPESLGFPCFSFSNVATAAFCKVSLLTPMARAQASPTTVLTMPASTASSVSPAPPPRKTARARSE